MRPEEMSITDLARIFKGQNPWLFLIECVIRILFLYFLIVLSMRLMGRRMAGQLSRIEMASLVSLAAAIGVPVQAPDRGLLPAFIISAVVVAIQRIISSLSAKNRKFESLAQDAVAILVEDGHIVWPNMNRALLNRERLFSELRGQGVENLGRVQRVYMEANGSFSILQYEEPRPGLSIIPDCDDEFKAQQRNESELLACHHCGALRNPKSDHTPACATCGAKGWAPSVIG